jgi:hypothetical protein
VNNVAENSNSDVLEIEIDPNALHYLKKHGDVFILTDVENPQYSYYRIKSYDVNLIIKFEEFVEVCKTCADSQTNINESQTEFAIRIFNVKSPSNAMPSNLGFYVAKSGFSTVDDWLKTLKDDEIPECSTGRKKTYYLYHIQTSRK